MSISEFAAENDNATFKRLCVAMVLLMLAFVFAFLSHLVKILHILILSAGCLFSIKVGVRLYIQNYNTKMPILQMID